MKTLFALALCLCVLGCQRSRPHLKADYQRFLPIQPTNGMMEGIPWHGFFALDTKTGSLCRTVSYDVFPKGKPDDLGHSLLSCSDILRAEQEAAKH